MKQIEWRVRLACAERGIWSAAELQRLVLRRTGVHLNVQTLQAWFRSRPVRIEVRTLNAVLNALGCNLTDLIQLNKMFPDLPTKRISQHLCRRFFSAPTQNSARTLSLEQA